VGIGFISSFTPSSSFWLCHVSVTNFSPRCLSSREKCALFVFKATCLHRLYLGCRERGSDLSITEKYKEAAKLYNWIMLNE